MNKNVVLSLFLETKGRRISSGLLFTGFLILVFFIGRIEYRSEITDYFPPESEKIIEFKKLEAQFGKQDNFIVLLHFGAQPVTTPTSLATLYTVVKAIEAIPGVQYVRSLLDFPISQTLDDELQTTSVYRIFEQQHTLLSNGEGQLADAFRTPSVWLSQSKAMTSVQIQFYPGAEKELAYQQVIALLDQHNGIEAFRWGPLEIQKELQRSLLHDGLYLMPLVILVGICLMWIFLRSWWLIAAGTLAILMALAMTGGLCGLLGMAVNQTSVLAFGIVFIVVLAEVIHVLTGYMYACQTQSRQRAMNATISHNLGSLFLTSFTTFFGFISLNISNSPAFAVFGNIASIGVTFAFLATVTVVPVLCELAPKPRLHPFADKFQHTLGNFSQLSLRYPKSALLVIALVTLPALPGVTRNIFQNDPLDYFDNTTAISKTTHAFKENFGVKHHVTLLLEGDHADAALSPYMLDVISQFRLWADAQPEIVYTLGYDTVLARLQASLHDNDPRWAVMPLQTETVGELINVYQMSSPHNSLRSLGINTDSRSAVLTLGIPPLSSSEIAALEAKLLDWFATNAPQLKISVTGHAPLFANIGLSLTMNMVVGDLTTVLVITLILAFSFRSMRLGLVTLIPNIIPPAVIYGIWGYLVGKIDIAAAGAFSMGMGIIVDDTIHILRNYVIFRQQGHDPEESLRHTFRHSGPALVLTTLVLSSGLGVLCLAKFGPNQVTAQMMASTIALALIYDLALLPLVLKSLDKWLLHLQPLVPTQIPPPG